MHSSWHLTPCCPGMIVCESCWDLWDQLVLFLGIMVCLCTSERCFLWATLWYTWACSGLMEDFKAQGLVPGVHTERWKDISQCVLAHTDTHMHAHTDTDTHTHTQTHTHTHIHTHTHAHTHTQTHTLRHTHTHEHTHTRVHMHTHTHRHTHTHTHEHTHTHTHTCRPTHTHLHAHTQKEGHKPASACCVCTYPLNLNLFVVLPASPPNVQAANKHTCLRRDLVTFSTFEQASNLVSPQSRGPLMVWC